MNSAEFVACVAKEKEALLATYLDAGSGAAVAKDIESLRLTTAQREAMKKILDGALTDAFYTLLLALDGAATLDGKQRRFELRVEDGALLTGDLESPAWQAFHGKTSK
jgi:hypothetical protein